MLWEPVMGVEYALGMENDNDGEGVHEDDGDEGHDCVGGGGRAGLQGMENYQLAG
jgi:hypothetical protein